MSPGSLVLLFLLLFLQGNPYSLVRSLRLIRFRLACTLRFNNVRGCRWTSKTFRLRSRVTLSLHRASLSAVVFVEDIWSGGKPLRCLGGILGLGRKIEPTVDPVPVAGRRCRLVTWGFVVAQIGDERSLGDRCVRHSTRCPCSEWRRKWGTWNRRLEKWSWLSRRSSSPLWSDAAALFSLAATGKLRYRESRTTESPWARRVTHIDRM